MRAVPGRPVDVDFAAQPIIDKENSSILLRITADAAEDNSGSGALEQWAARGCRWQMLLAFPIKTPGMSPTEMRAIERREDFVPHRLIVIGPQPGKSVIESDIPGISETARDDFQVFTIGVSPQNPSFSTPIVLGIVVILSVLALLENQWLWKMPGC